MHALISLFAHAEGEPIKRILHQHMNANGSLDAVGALRDSPALADAVERALANARFRTRNQKAEKTVEAELPPE